VTRAPSLGSVRPATAVELKQVLAAERRGVPFLVYRDEEGAQRIVSLAGRGLITLGRRTGNDIPLAWDTQVSRAHAAIECIGGEWAIADDGLSRNGTYVNGTRIHGHVRLRDGDTIRCGETALLFRSPGEGASEMTSAALEERPTVARLSDTQRRVLIALCRPYKHSGQFGAPATNQDIADEVFLSLDAVKANLRILFQKFGLQDAPRTEKRVRLVELAFQWGLVSQRDL
jgi:pSer/pThr/pTyr-binding forkhead associated (FHA) protein